MKVTVSFNQEEYKRLERLAERRGCSVERCLRRFAENCQPDGGGWVHPTVVEAPEEDDTLVS